MQKNKIKNYLDSKVDLKKLSKEHLHNNLIFQAVISTVKLNKKFIWTVRLTKRNEHLRSDLHF